MNLKDAVLMWNPDGEFRVAPRGEVHDDMMMTVGAVFADWHKMTPERRLNQLFAEMVTIHHAGEVPFDVMHRAMLGVREYRELLSEDSHA